MSIQKNIIIKLKKRHNLEDLINETTEKLLEKHIRNYIAKNISLEKILEIENPKFEITINKIKKMYQSILINNFRNNVQDKYLNDSIEYLEKFNRIILKAPTGFGKTVLLYKLINKLLPNLILWCTPRRNLNIQANDEKYTKFLKNEAYETYNYSPDEYDNSNKFDNLIKFIKTNKKENKKMIIFVCYQSCSTLIPKLYKKCIKLNLIICDEAHTIESWGNLIDKHTKLLLQYDVKINKDDNFVDKYIFVTATPKNDMDKIKYKNREIFGKIIEHVQIYELIKYQILCDFDVIIKKMEDINNDDIINNKLDLCNFVYDSMMQYNKKKGVIYFNSQHRARIFYRKMKKAFPKFRSFLYISDEDDIIQFEEYDISDTKLSEFEKCKEPCIIITCDKLSYGYDNVFIDLICFGDPRTSDIAIRQILGRGMRNNIDEYPDKILHVIIPIYKFQALNESENIDILTKQNLVIKKQEQEYDIKSFEKLREFILFILSECGKDIINGCIVNKNNNRQNNIIQNTNNSSIDDNYDEVKIPPTIYKPLCSKYTYSKFIRYLSINNIYDDNTYNASRDKCDCIDYCTDKDECKYNIWMPILGDIRKRYKKFCFKDINAKENETFYETVEECKEAYEKIRQQTVLELGGMSKVKKMLKSTFEKKLNTNINIMDNKIPPNKYLFYYDETNIEV